MKWIDIEKELPPVNTRVRLSYGLFGIRAAVCDDWISTGWLTKSGIWSIKWIPNSTMHRLSKPTHWMPLV